MTKMIKQVMKKVETSGPYGSKNGWLLELYKDEDKTLVYMVTLNAFTFKGYHLHRAITARWVCIKGSVKVTTYEWKDSQWILTETILNEGDALSIPPNMPTGIENLTDGEGWLINYPDPPYNPDMLDEQVGYTESEIVKGVLK